MSIPDSPSGGKKPKSSEEMSDQLDRLQATVENLTAGLSEAANRQLKSAQQTLESSVRQNPIAAVCFAAAAGFLYAFLKR